MQAQCRHIQCHHTGAEMPCGVLQPCENYFPDATFSQWSLQTTVANVSQGCIWALRREGGNAVVETLQEVKGDMIKAGLKWNKRTHALFVDVHLLECNTEVS